MTAVVDKAKCDNQGNCVVICPVEAITIVDGKAVIDPEKCVDCEACVSACALNAISMKQES